MLRFVAESVENLFCGYEQAVKFRQRAALSQKPSGARKLAIHDPHMSALTFNRGL